ncbi:hypothetical protein AKUA1202_05970 [Apilactobacillus kunkeei]|uniref:DUF1694 domain-containing protein n=1 Tax=Apilactobacillus kunkeei EFB6 TaxID=1419324 RepID=A0A836YWK0_9LACO|nr:YueI family protein [Apilactobacillus kunkeei]KDB01082.1 hypothetical protein LAKU_8c00550 [Apilactobacillus kunkeei EFB6]TPR50872.1 DUF1694 domain-containing protein [Apilactobacillus kunkeei]CAI2583572.1 hypothetical protein AKUA1401_05140 [Apilactobacillus kunkeei]CAI2660554.1 hypothetical protein AKUH4B504J_05910 [Apilactobacillus kunkeei]CAI2661597.1 hypothetical protein AKUH4B505J_05400 [Apilactobacillus kunkeei]
MSEDDVSSRLEQSSMGGTPKVNPDEQRRYLGTFRERVSLAIQIKDLSNPNAVNALQKEFDNNNSYQLIINGNLDHDVVSPFIRLASQNNIKFVIKTDLFYRTAPDNYGVVYANSQSINVNPVDFEEKYNQQDTTTDPSNDSEDKQANQSFFGKLKNIFK